MARDFNGTSDKLSRTSSVLGSGNPVGTLVAWVRPDVLNASMTVLSLSRSTSTTPLYRIILQNTGKLLRQYRSDGMILLNAFGATTLSTTDWQHVAGTFTSDGSGKIYLNGVEDGSVTNAGSAVSITLDRTTVGVLTRTSDGDFWNGVIAECAVYSDILTGAEIAQLASGDAANLVRPDILVAYWPILGDSSPEPDSIGGFDLTVTGTTKATHPTINSGGGGALVGTSDATSGATGTLTGAGALSGTSAATSGATGTLSSGAGLSGTIAANSNATGTLTGAGALSGTSAATSGATGMLAALDAGSVSGTIAAVSGATGTLKGTGALSGTITAMSGATASFETAANDVGGGIFFEVDEKRRRADRKRRRKEEKRRLDDLRALYDRLSGVETEEATQVAEAVEPYVIETARTQETKALPPVSMIDWRELAQHKQTLRALEDAMVRMEATMKREAQEREDIEILMLVA